MDLTALLPIWITSATTPWALMRLPGYAITLPGKENLRLSFADSAKESAQVMIAMGVGEESFALGCPIALLGEDFHSLDQVVQLALVEAALAPLLTAMSALAQKKVAVTGVMMMDEVAQATPRMATMSCTRNGKEWLQGSIEVNNATTPWLADWRWVDAAAQELQQLQREFRLELLTFPKEDEDTLTAAAALETGDFFLVPELAATAPLLSVRLHTLEAPRVVLKGTWNPADGQLTITGQEESSLSFAPLRISVAAPIAISLESIRQCAEKGSVDVALGRPERLTIAMGLRWLDAQMAAVGLQTALQILSSPEDTSEQ